MPSVAGATGAGIKLTPDPKAITRSTNTWTGSQTFVASTTFIGPITADGGCVGCGGGSAPSLQSPATGPYNLADIGSVINSTGFYANSGSIAFATTVPQALLHINGPAGGGGRLMLISTNTQNLFEVWPSSVVVSSVSVLIQSTVSYGIPLAVGLNGRAMPNLTRIVAAFSAGDVLNATGRILFRNGAASAQLGVDGVGDSFVGSVGNTSLHIRVNDTARFSFDSAGNFYATTAGRSLVVGGNTVNGDALAVIGGSGTIRGAGAGLSVGTTGFLVHREGGVSIGTGTRTGANLRIESGNNNGASLIITSGTARIMEVRRASTTIGNYLVVTDSAGTGAGGGISVSTYTVMGSALIKSTFSVNASAFDGTVIRLTTGSVAANISLTVVAADLGLSSILWVMCSEVENINTAGTSVRPKALANLPASFEVYNADVINTKGFSCIAVGKP